MNVRDIPPPDTHPALAAKRERLAAAETRLAQATDHLAGLHTAILRLEDVAAAAALAGDDTPTELAATLSAIGPAESACRIAEKSVALAADDLAAALNAARAAYATETREALAAVARAWARQAREMARASAELIAAREHVEGTSARGVVGDLPHCPPHTAPQILLNFAQAFDAWAAAESE